MEPDPARHARSAISALEAALRAALEQRADLRWAYLFGSVARGEDFADVDLALMPVAGAFASAVELSALGAELAAACGPDTAAIEVVDLRAAALPLLAEILDDGRLLVDHQPATRRHWEADARLRWLDFEPLWRMHRRLRRQGLRERKGK